MTEAAGLDESPIKQARINYRRTTYRARREAGEYGARLALSTSALESH